MTVFHIETENAEAFRKGNTMPSSQAGQMSQDRVRFWLPSNYYNTGHSVIMCSVLRDAFGLSYGQSERVMKDNELGFWIVCRPSQFARFMIYRNNAGIKNGFMDLKSELFTPLSDTQDVYRVLGDEINVRSGDVYKVTIALGLTSGHVRDRMRGASVTQEIDVSQNIMSGETVSVTN